MRKEGGEEGEGEVAVHSKHFFQPEDISAVHVGLAVCLPDLI